MQKYKDQFINSSSPQTLTDLQGCLRLTDLNEIGDGSHRLYFQMLGLFSFDQLTLEESIDFWMGYLGELGINPDTVTIHPDKFEEWSLLYSKYPVELKEDPENIWTDPSSRLGGYCTEFYLDGIEIGNIVNTSGRHIDSGFGLERIMICLGGKPPGKQVIMKKTILEMIRSGIRPSNKKQGYILRKLLRLLIQDGYRLEHRYFYEEKRRIEKIRDRYESLKEKHSDQSPDWWWETHGIDINDI